MHAVLQAGRKMRVVPNFVLEIELRSFRASPGGAGRSFFFRPLPDFFFLLLPINGRSELLPSTGRSFHENRGEV